METKRTNPSLNETIIIRCGDKFYKATVTQEKGEGYFSVHFFVSNPAGPGLLPFNFAEHGAYWWFEDEFKISNP